MEGLDSEGHQKGRNAPYSKAIALLIRVHLKSPEFVKNICLSTHVKC